MPTQLELDLEEMLDTHPHQLTDIEKTILRPQLKAFLELLNTIGLSLRDLEILTDELPGRHDTLQ
jgi:hypothetical protein